MMNLRLEPALNSGDFFQTFSVRLDDGTLADLSLLTIEIAMQDVEDKEVWRGSTASGEITLGSPGEFTMEIPAATFCKIHQGVYSGGCRASLGAAVEALFTFELPIFDGNFSA